MLRKTRLITLAGLLLALAAGAIAARPCDEEEKECVRPAPTSRVPCDPGLKCGMPAEGCPSNSSSCVLKKEKGCPLGGICRSIAATLFGEPTSSKEKCCCSPDKPCKNCPCVEEPETAADAACPAGLTAGAFPPAFQFCTPMNGLSPMVGMPYPVPGFHPPMIPGSMPPPPLMPQMVMPQPVAVPQMAQIPPPPPMMPMQYLGTPEVEGKQYFVEMKLIEQCGNEKEKVVAMPRLCVSENTPGQLSCGTSKASLWAAGVPANDFGHEGYEAGVVVKADRPNHVSLNCWVSTSECDPADKECLRESRCSTTRTVELGKPATFPCDRVCAGKPCHCRLEVVVKEYDEHNVRGSTGPCEATYDIERIGSMLDGVKSARVGSNEPCEKPCERVYDEPRVKMIRFVAPRPTEIKKPAKMTFTTVAGAACCAAGEKECELSPPARMLKVCCEGTCLTCEKFDLEMPGYGTLKVCVDGDRVLCVGDTIKAKADTISCGGEDGILACEGHAHVVSHKNTVDAGSGTVRIKLEQSIITSMPLIQD